MDRQVALQRVRIVEFPLAVSAVVPIHVSVTQLMSVKRSVGRESLFANVAGDL